MFCSSPELAKAYHFGAHREGPPDLRRTRRPLQKSSRNSWYTPWPSTALSATSAKPLSPSQPDTTSLQAPGGFYAQASGARVSLAWTDTSQGEEGFIVERSPESWPLTYVEAGRVGANVTSFVDHAANNWNLDVILPGFRAAEDGGARVWWCFDVHPGNTEELAILEKAKDEIDANKKLVSMGLAPDMFDWSNDSAVEQLEIISRRVDPSHPVMSLLIPVSGA